MEKEVDSGYYNSSGQFIEAPKKQFFRLQIPYTLRFALIWTLFFIILGLVVQYFQKIDQAFSLSSLVTSFFTTDYVAWFKSFGSFSNVILYPTPLDFVRALLSKWYYFFYTGGLLSLIWGLLSWIIHFEFVVKKSLVSQSQVVQQIQPVIQPIILKPIEKIEIPIKEEIVPIKEPLKYSSINQSKIEEWLEAGLLMLAQGNIYEAELIYEQISRAYDLNNDITHETYKRILDFYYEINERKNNLSK